jgi:hypothetical protein
VEHVRLKRAPVQGPVARLRLSHLLSSATLKPPAMPPSAILFVRAMADPLPGRITNGFAPGSLASAEWETAAQNSLGQFYRRAARPMWGPVAPNAEAVLFADYAEMLACLAGDFVVGRASAWWWRSLQRPIPGRSAGSSWMSAWMERPLYVPAALDHLEARQQAAAVLDGIAPSDAWNLLMTALREFDLPALMISRGPLSGPVQANFTPVEESPENAVPPVETHEGRRQSVATAIHAATTIHRLPWEPDVSQASTPVELGYERRALLGIGLLLRRAPHVASTTAFALRFRAWVRAEESRGHAIAQESAVSEVSRDGNHDSWEHSESRSAHSSIPDKAGPPLPEEPPQPAQRQNESAPGQTIASESDRFQPIKAVTHSKVIDYPVHQIRPILSPVLAQDLPAPTPAVTPPRDWADGDTTRAGGILYLIHLLRQAELLRHFDTGLGGWALLELLARCLLDDSPVLEGDAIWAALAHLDGRDPRLPAGWEFKPQHVYTAPESWLKHVAEPSRFVRFRSRGVEHWVGEGFLVLDSDEVVMPAGSPLRMSSLRLRGLRQAARVRPVGISVSPELRRFLHFLLPYARWRLNNALRGSSLRDALLRTGRLYVTPTHVDLVMPMDETRVPVRLAGLDANPSWVPALGRVINFHFIQKGHSNG